MLKLLLDEHISPRVVAGLTRRHPGIVVQYLADWEAGGFLGRNDLDCLLAAAAHDLTLVTYDRRTIPPLLKAWAEEGRDHGGVIFVDEKTIPPNAIGELVRALSKLWEASRKWDWKNRVCFLER